MNNQSVKPIRSYATGGASDDCYDIVVDADGRKRKKKKKDGCGFAKAQKFNQKQAKKQKRKENVKNILGGIGAAAAATGAYLGNFMGVRDKIENKKTGGAVKPTMQKRKGGPVKTTTRGKK